MSRPSPKFSSVVVGGVTGSIAAHKSGELVSRLVKKGWEGHVAMTRGAQQFITPLTFQRLSRNPVITNVFDVQGWKPGHVDLADRADLLLIAPATANIIAELAHGLAANPITEIALATLAPVLIAPAMNGKMWLHTATQANVETLRMRGVEFIGPEDGQLACGYHGAGRLWPVDGIVEKAMNSLSTETRNPRATFAAEGNDRRRPIQHAL